MLAPFAGVDGTGVVDDEVGTVVADDEVGAYARPLGPVCDRAVTRRAVAG